MKPYSPQNSIAAIGSRRYRRLSQHLRNATAILESQRSMQSFSEGASCYPRVYRLRRFAKIVHIFMGALFVGLGIWIVIDRANHLTGSPWGIFDIVLSLFAIPTGLRLVGAALNYQLILDHDKIRLSSVLGTQELNINAIAGWIRDGREITLIPQNPRIRRLSLQLDTIQLDECFHRWLASIPELNDQGRPRSLAFEGDGVGLRHAPS